MKLKEFLKEKYNYNPDMKDNMQGYFDLWEGCYRGNIAGFHNYKYFNGIADIDIERYTMNMPKEISEDWSDILWSEKCEISMKDEANQEQFDELEDELSIDEIVNQSIEKSGALGTCANVVSVYDIVNNEDGMTLDVSEAKTRVDIVDVDWIFPLSWSNKGITECAFGSVEYKNGNKYVILSVHKIAEDGNYHIYNHLFRDEKGELYLVEQTDGTLNDFNTKSDTKWFSIYKPNLTNNIFANSPFGIPHYANAIDNVKAVDISFDALKNEIEDGRRRTFVRADMLTYEDGTLKRTFKKNEKSIYVLPKGATKDDLIQSDSDDLRTDKQIATLNMNLNILGNKVGFGENHYHFDGTNLSTATAVVSSNSKMFRRKKKLEIGYESSIYDLIKAVCYASSEFGKYNIDTNDMVITFDDSIIEDKEAESLRAYREVNAGLISKVEYREKVLGETTEIAEENIKKINELEPNVEDMINE